MVARAAGSRLPRINATQNRDRGAGGNGARTPVLLIGLVILVGLIGLLYVSQSSAVATIGYDLRRLELERDREIARNEQLLLEIGQLESLPRLEEAANRRGLVPPDRVIFVTAPVEALARKPAIAPAGAARRSALNTPEQPDPTGAIKLLFWQLRDGAFEVFNAVVRANRP